MFQAIQPLSRRGRHGRRCSEQRRRRALMFEPLEQRDCPSSGQVAVSGAVHQGDLITFTAVANSDDPSEDNEGGQMEYLFVYSELTSFSQGGFLHETKLHNQQETFTYQARKDGEQFYWYYSGDDDDETPVVQATAGAAPSRFSPEQREEFRKFAEQLTAVADGESAAAQFLEKDILPNPAAEKAKEAFVLLLEADAARGHLLALKYDLMANDPPDPNYTSIAQPVPAPLPLVTRQPGMPRDLIRTANRLLQNESQAIGLADAIYTSVNRASGAAAAGDASWQGKQLQAVQTYSLQLASLMSAQSTLRSNLHSNVLHALRHTGIDPTLTTDDVTAFEQDVAANGLPAYLQQDLALAGAGSDAVAAVTNAIIVQDPSLVAGSISDKVADPALAGAARGAATALRTSAGKAGPLSQVIGDSQGNLFSVDLANGGTTYLGQTTVPMQDIALSRAGRLYGLDQSNGSSHLYRINVNRSAHTVTTTLIGDLGATASALEFRRDGTLFVAGPDRLYRVNRHTGTARAVANLPGTITASGDLTFDGTGKLYTLVSATDGTTSLFQLDARLKTWTRVGSAGAAAALAFSGGNLYAIEPDGSILAIDPGDASSSQVAMADIASAHGDLGGAASVPAPGR
jgi:hypothetical protein